MTTEQRKEELRKKFEEYFWFDGILSTRETRRLVPFNRDNAFNFFYSEIEAREKQIDIEERAERIEDSTFEERCSEASHYTWLDDENKRLETKIQRLEEIIKAADEYIKYQIELDNISCQTGGNPITTGQRIIKANREMLEALSHYQHLKEKQK